MSGRRAFTLIELLVVMGIIGIVAALLLPALSRSKARAQSIMCMNSNMRQLALAWTMYSSDNSDRLPYNLSPSTSSRPMAASPISSSSSWVNNIMDWELTPGNTNLSFVNQSILAPWASYATKIYHCPSDRALSTVQKVAGWSGRVRSISMNAMVGDPGTSLQGSDNNADDPGYQQFVRESDFKDPSAIFVFLDEHPDSIDDGYFINAYTNAEWIDLPASYHNGGGSFTFADGHTEIHRWQSASTMPPNQPDAAGLPLALAPGDTADFSWVSQHASIATH